MPCLSDQTTFDFLEHRLSEANEREIRAHLDECNVCRELVADTARAKVGRQPVLEPGARVGRYVLEYEVGAGAMGVVYTAHDPELDRRVAVKILRAEPADKAIGEDARQRMEREARAVKRLAHPNVVAVYDVGDIGDAMFVVMEFVPGETLAKWLDEPRAHTETVERFVEAGRGLAAAHEAGLVHRDFKPGNVLIGLDGRARVTDFGLARRSSFAPRRTETMPDGEHPGELALATRNRTGMFAGTPAYMAPEQLTHQRATARTDQFSFCVAFYEALYGERPFESATVEELLANVLGGRIRPSPPGSSVPPDLRSALLRGLHGDPAQRHPSMNALLDACVAYEKEPGRRPRWMFWR
jgi:serine/threonine protein kinase